MTDLNLDINVPVVIIIDRQIQVRRDRPHSKYVLTAWVTPQGTIGYGLDNGLGGAPLALSTLQPDGTVLFPTKPVPGWQEQVRAFVESSLYGDKIEAVQ